MEWNWKFLGFGFISQQLYYTPIEGAYVPYIATEQVYNATDNSLISIGGDCYEDGNLSDCYIVNYVKRAGDDIEFSFNLSVFGDGLIYANGNLIGNLSFYQENYTFVIPNLDANENHVISLIIDFVDVPKSLTVFDFNETSLIILIFWLNKSFKILKLVISF